MRHLVTFVSGHGFGHAARTAEVCRALAAHRPGLRQTIVTSAPARFFAGIADLTVTAPAGPCEAGVLEHDPLLPDVPATLRLLEARLADADAAVAALARQIDSLEADAVSCDVPFLVGPAARRAGRRCTAVSNFTWDWIYEPFLAEHPRRGEFLDRIRAAYGDMTALLRLPFGGTADTFARVIDVPLVAGHAERPRDEVLAFLGVDPADRRPRVLAAARGGLAADTMLAAARSAPECLLLTNVPLGGADLPANLRALPPDGSIRYADLIAACDVVVAKLGYGIVAECLAAGTGLLYPPRRMFREDLLTSAAIPRHIRAGPLPEDDYRAGRWGDRLRGLLAQAVPDEPIRTDGADVVAGHLLESA